jgi:flagellar biosynthesis/type III secretory pathway M-ring protein FliF/YscJ
MDKNSVVVSIMSATSVFIYLTLPTLKEVYGKSAVIWAYAVISILVGFLVYMVLSRIKSHVDTKRKTEDKEESNNQNDEQSKDADEDDNVQREMEIIRSQDQQETES